MIEGINGVKPCRRVAEKDTMAQWSYCHDEMSELYTAIKECVVYGNDRNRAEIAFEAVDVIASVTTLLDSMFTEEEIKKAIEYVNAKNYVRGYIE